MAPSNLYARGNLPVVVHALRLSPGDDLREHIVALARRSNIHAGFVMAAVGSLSVARLRFAGLSDAAEIRGDLEVVSLSGTIATDAAVHLHMSIADHEGAVRGGHVLAGCIVRTTAEIIIGECLDLQFSRPVDSATGYRELLPEMRR